MSNPIFVIPHEVPTNARIIIRSSSTPFQEKVYLISDTQGKIIRRGKIAKDCRELYLSVVGLCTGVYYLSVGSEHEKFVVF